MFEFRVSQYMVGEQAVTVRAKLYLGFWYDI
jgi:hypothetical protein